MYKAFSPVASLLVAAIVCGCGGGGGGSNGSVAGGGTTSTGGPNPLVGSYAGGGTVSNSSDPVAANIGVGSTSVLCGTLGDKTAKTKTLIGGQVSDTGAVSNGSFQTLDSHGTAVGSGLLVGQITPLGSGTASSSAVSAVFTTTSGNTVITYTFSNLPSLTAAMARARRRRRNRTLKPQPPVVAG